MNAPEPIPATSSHAQGPPQRTPSFFVRTSTILLLGATFLLVVLHYLHLTADFPHFSPWNDPARFTDEGWYTGAAVRHFLSSSWRLPGDFNPAAALPVFPLLVAALFRFTGVSVSALRALNVTFFAASLLTTWTLVRRYSTQFAAAGAVFLIASSPIYYAYSRLGTLEPLLSLESLLALLAASSIYRNHAGYKSQSLIIGFLLAVLPLTKTTGLCVYPAVLYLILSRCNFNLKTAFRPIALATSVAGGIVIAYLVLVRHFGLTDDFTNLFAINKGHIHGRILLTTLWATFREGATIGQWFYYLSVATILLFAIVRRKRQPPLFVASVLGILGCGAFIVYHGWLIPRYYYVPVPLIATAVVLSLAELTQSSRISLRLTSASLATTLLIVSLSQVCTLIQWTRYPSYSYVQAAQRLYQIIDRDPSQNRVVFSSVSEQMALLTGEPGIFLNPTYGTTPLSERILRYRPGWEITFNPATPYPDIYSQLVDTEPIYGDDPMHADLYLYKLTLNQH